MPLTPEQVKKLRLRADKTQTEAANDVYVALRTWQSWETPKKSTSRRAMPEGLVELFCIKNGIKYPPRF